MIHAAAVSLVHADYIHPGSQAISRDSKHVLRFARSFEPMQHDQRESLPPLDFALLPVAPASNLDSWRNLDESLLGGRQVYPPGQKEAGNRLYVSSTQPTSRTERRPIRPQVRFRNSRF